MSDFNALFDALASQVFAQWRDSYGNAESFVALDASRALVGAVANCGDGVVLESDGSASE